MTYDQTPNHELINQDRVLPFTGFHDFLDVGEQKMHVGLAESVD